MYPEEVNNAILRFFRDDIGGILITGEDGSILYADRMTAFVQNEKKTGPRHVRTALPVRKAKHGTC